MRHLALRAPGGAARSGVAAANDGGGALSRRRHHHVHHRPSAASELGELEHSARPGAGRVTVVLGQNIMD